MHICYHLLLTSYERNTINYILTDTRVKNKLQRYPIYREKKGWLLVYIQLCWACSIIIPATEYISTHERIIPCTSSLLFLNHTLWCTQVYIFIYSSIFGSSSSLLSWSTILTVVVLPAFTSHSWNTFLQPRSPGAILQAGQISSALKKPGHLFPSA